ncbi:MAG: hypothetical protein M5U26_01465 [Planctomycetota bacterium]|nr:hypothetical protein [Planctomycetota bacterium]
MDAHTAPEIRRLAQELAAARARLKLKLKAPAPQPPECPRPN